LRFERSEILICPSFTSPEIRDSFPFKLEFIHPTFSEIITPRFSFMYIDIDVKTFRLDVLESLYLLWARPSAGSKSVKTELLQTGTTAEEGACRSLPGSLSPLTAAQEAQNGQRGLPHLRERTHLR
jgi:hypothetical protein